MTEKNLTLATNLLPTTGDPTTDVTIDELLARDPLKLTEADLDQNVKILVKLVRAEREVWKAAKAKATANKTRLNAAAIKKEQAKAARRALSDLLPDLGI